ncbi:hypothetical protein BKA60DRAFT_644172 [Fusarium oxysporum]|nr:hypothetical protein BKA60DRAFT_644172 [Fusarium oxysporum]
MTRSCLARFHILEAIVNHLAKTTALPKTSPPLLSLSPPSRITATLASKHTTLCTDLTSETVILTQTLGLCVSIWVAYQPAEEYHPPHITPVRDSNLGDEVAVTHYFIESQTGKNFHIRYRFSPLFTFSDGAVAIILKFIDGIECQQLVMNHEDLIEIAPVELAKRATVVSDIERIKTLRTIKVMIGFGKTCPGSGYP